MKIFFTVLIAIIAIFYYIFVQSQVQTHNKLDSTTLDSIEYKDNTDITTNTFENESPKGISENHTFDEMKNILRSIRNIQYKRNITLNDRITSYVYTQEDKDIFKQSIASKFNIKYNEVDKQYKEHKLIWDWVNYLKNR